MQDLIFLIPALPLVGAIILGLIALRQGNEVAASTAAQLHLSKARLGVAIIGVGSVFIAALLSFWVGAKTNAGFTSATQSLWTWMSVQGFQSVIQFRLDPISFWMTLVITGVGALIHLYSVEYMANEADYTRFFATMNLFVALMLILVLADNLLLLFLGWEGVGLCSYLLIGFWYTDPNNVRAAQKAFLVTRLGDVAFMLGLLLIFTQLGTLDIPMVIERAKWVWGPGAPVAQLAAFLLLGGAIGKSAQLPLQVWLPDAMAGPTPVSALIHAATMVTAGVYLIARLSELFALAPGVQWLVAWVGAITLLMAALSALYQEDVKRVLAYSTISQMGYLFLALGVGAQSAALFHLGAHALFKSLLFLAAGAVILFSHHEQNLLKLGGLRKKIPFVFWVFVIGVMASAAVPFITLGFYSKDFILSELYRSGERDLWFLALVGAFLTSLYSFRLLLLIFFGKERVTILPVHAAYARSKESQIGGKLGLCLLIPLGILALGLVVAPWLGLDSEQLRWLSPQLGETSESPVPRRVEVMAGVASLAGLIAAVLFYGPSSKGRPLRSAARFLHNGWGFDTFYHHVFVQPFSKLVYSFRKDWIDSLFNGIAKLHVELFAVLSRMQTGQVREYALAVATGAVLMMILIGIIGLGGFS